MTRLGEVTRRVAGKGKRSGRADRNFFKCSGDVERRREERLAKAVYKSKLKGRRNSGRHCLKSWKENF